MMFSFHGNLFGLFSSCKNDLDVFFGLKQIDVTVKKTYDKIWH